MKTFRIIAVTRVALLLSGLAVTLSILPVVSIAAPTQVPPPAARTPRSQSEDLSKLSDAEIDQRIQTVGQAPGEIPQQPSDQPWSPALIKFLTIEVLVFGIIVIIVMGVLVLNNAST